MCEWGNYYAVVREIDRDEEICCHYS
jgi:hypothetical protein